jgi:hypothetical protein
MTTYSVTLTFAKPAGVETYRSQAFYRLEVTASSPQNMPAQIFIHQRHETGDPNLTTRDEFLHVAGPLDLTELSTTPDIITGKFRKNTVNLMLPKADLYGKVKEEIQARVTGLCNALAKMETVIPEDPVVISASN